MEILLVLLLFLISLTGLIIAADIFVQGAIALAEKFNISKKIIGLTLVSAGTSAPEFFVSLNAAMDGAYALSIGNVIGSNIANILLILGMCSVIKATVVSRADVFLNGTFLMIATLTISGFWLLGDISRLSAFALLVLCGCYYWALLYFQDKLAGVVPNFEEITQKKTEAKGRISGLPLWGVVLVLCGSGVGIYYGAEYSVYNATILAKYLNISEAVIALSLVAVGTSTPELVVSVLSVLKNEDDIAYGNIVGSNIFNIVFVMGVSAAIAPLKDISEISSLDILFFIFSASLLVLLCFFRKGVGRFAGGLMIVFYGVYLALLFNPTVWQTIGMRF